MMATVLAGCFSLLFLLSVLYQFNPRWMKPLKHRDFFNLLPAWNFFAPTPVTRDFRLLYRDRLAGGDTTAWQEVAFISPHRLSRAVWNPYKRRRKALYDTMATLVATHQKLKDHPERLPYSLSYLTLLHLVTGQPAGPTAEARQFAVMYSHGYRAEVPAELVMHSPFHPLDT